MQFLKESESEEHHHLSTSLKLQSFTKTHHLLLRLRAHDDSTLKNIGGTLQWDFRTDFRLKFDEIGWRLLFYSVYCQEIRFLIHFRPQYAQCHQVHAPSPLHSICDIPGSDTICKPDAPQTAPSRVHQRLITCSSRRYPFPFQ